MPPTTTAPSTACSKMAESASGVVRYPKTPLLTKEWWHPDGLYRDDGVVLIRYLSPITLSPI